MSEGDAGHSQQVAQTHYNIKDYFNKLDILERMPKPPSYSHPGSDYDRIFNVVKGIMTNLNFFVNPRNRDHDNKSSKVVNLWFESMDLFDKSYFLQNNSQIQKLLLTSLTPEFTYIRPFYKYDQNDNYGTIPLEKYDFIFILLHSILEHYTFKKPELLQSMYTLLGNNPDSLFPCLYVNLTPEDKALIKDQIISGLYNFGAQGKVPRKQFPTEETVQKNADVFTYINSLFVTTDPQTQDNVPIIPNYLALMNFGELICKKADLLVPPEDKSEYNSKKHLAPYILIARQLAEAFQVPINLCLLGKDPENPENHYDNKFLNTTEPKLISQLYMFITTDLGFAGKLVFQNYWNADKIYKSLEEIENAVKREQGQPVN